MNSKRGFKRITFALAAVAALSGTVIGVIIVINEYENAKGFLRWKRENLVRDYGDIFDSLAFERTGKTDQQSNTMLGGPVRLRQPQQYQRPPGSADPRRMMANQMDMELNSVTQWFNSQISILDQQMLGPDKYKAEYAKLQRQAINQRVAIDAKHEANAQQIRNMQKLVEAGTISPEQMEQTMLVMAGIPVEHVRKAFAQVQREKTSTQLNRKYTQVEAEVRELERGFWIQLSKPSLVALCVAGGLVGAFIGFSSAWFILWFCGLVIFRWLILGFCDDVSSKQVESMEAGREPFSSSSIGSKSLLEENQNE